MGPVAQGPVAQGAAAKPHAEEAHAPAPVPARVEAAPPARPRVAAPDPALLEPSRSFAPALLPRVAADGRAARVVYAGPLPAAVAGAPRIALLVAGFGQSERDSRAALDQLPGAVAFAVSAYAGTQAAMLEAARAAGHELLASVPMEPQGFPLNDAGTRSLLTGLTAEDNRLNLEWALSRTQGAVGATGASDGMRGERFAEVSGAIDPVLDEIGRRGLLYVDPRPGRAPSRPGLMARAVDVVLDDSPARAEIEGKLVTLERVARERGSAIGLAGQLRPVTIERIADWAKKLEARGLVLVPVSALVNK